VQAPGADQEHGRGLRIVDALAADWGTEFSPAGRATWCYLAPSASRLSAARSYPQPPIDSC
jgi:hypothetical protein